MPRLWSALRCMLLAGTVALLLLPACRAPAGPVPVSAIPVSTSSPLSLVTLALLGDVMLGRDVHPSAESFAYLAPSLQAADLALANLESPLTRAPVQTESPYALCALPEHAELLAQAGIDLLTLANNHILDCGEQGLLDTRSTLTAAGLAFVGPGREAEMREIKGVKLAFLAFDATGAFDLESAGQAVRRAHAKGAVVIVSMHWGAEYQAGVSPYQEEIAAYLVQAGAGLIWGHHPHVLQPAAWTPPGRTLVFYSLGNALFDQGGLANTRQSALALVRLAPGGVVEYRAIPFQIDIQNSRITTPDAASAQTVMKYFIDQQGK